MSARVKLTRGRLRLPVLLAALVVTAALLVTSPTETRAQWKDCVDDSFGDYNSCLMSGSGWFEHALCDLDWEFSVSLCTARAVGEIRAAWRG